MRRRIGLAACALLVATSATGAGEPRQPPCLRGVNLAGAEFGTLPGRAHFNYAYPTAEDLRRTAEAGATAIRLPFRWERLQPRLGEAFDPGEAALLDAAVAGARAAGIATILDPHNYAYFGKARIGTAEVPVARFAEFWSRLATRFRREPSVVFSLMNEPHDIEARTWLAAANAAIAAIRHAGAAQLILVPGTSWTGAHSWQADLPVGNNAATMLGVADPGGNFAYDVHQYFDADFSGTKPDCSGAPRALAALDEMTSWLSVHGRRAFLGEFGVSERPDCIDAMRAAMRRLNAAPAQWAGWTAWAAGAFWSPTYPLSLQPDPGGRERPQMAALRPLFTDTAGRCGTRAR